MMNERVSTIMIKNLITLTPESTLAEVSEIFSTRKIHHIPVLEGGTLAGLITIYDLWRKNVLHEDYPKIKVVDVMSKKLIKLEPEDKIGTAAELFLDNRFHALPVVDGEKLVGLITTFDVLKYSFKKEYPDPILYKDVFDKESEKQ
jgi:CBS domain-containing protein